MQTNLIGWIAAVSRPPPGGLPDLLASVPNWRRPTQPIPGMHRQATPGRPGQDTAWMNPSCDALRNSCKLAFYPQAVGMGALGMNTQLADRIRMARRQAGLSQSGAAHALCVHRGTFGHWERGAGHRPTSANLSHLAVLMGVSYEWLATGRGSMRVSANEDDVPALRLDCFAQCDDEEALLQAFRRLPSRERKAVVDLARSGANQSTSQVTKLTAATPRADFRSPCASGTGG